jgi:hypothetical protein
MWDGWATFNLMCQQLNIQIGAIPITPGAELKTRKEAYIRFPYK